MLLCSNEWHSGQGKYEDKPFCPACGARGDGRITMAGAALAFTSEPRYWKNEPSSELIYGMITEVAGGSVLVTLYSEETQPASVIERRRIPTGALHHWFLCDSKGIPATLLPEIVSETKVDTTKKPIKKKKGTKKGKKK
jgi:hypothetical protein